MSFHDGRHVPVQYPVLINLAPGIVSGMKCRIDRFAHPDENIVRKKAVEPFEVYVRAETGITVETGSLADSMDTGICPPGACQTDRFSRHGRQRFFDLSLNGPIRLLPLPAMISSAVVSHNQSEIFHFAVQSISPTEREKNEKIVEKTMADDASSVSLLSWDERT